jgi:hypothetical protein
MEAGSAKPGLDEILPNSSEWASVAAVWLEGGAHHKTVPLKIKKLWRIRTTPLFQQYDAESNKLGRPKQLFHGTSLFSAQKIARDGFRLPSHAGKYGKGLYFAFNPHKSACYAEGQMLVCDVYLGSSRKVVSASWNNVEPSKDLKGGWLRKTLGMGEYHSIYAVGLIGETECIVYKESQAVPRYLIEYQYDRK